MLAIRVRSGDGCVCDIGKIITILPGRQAIGEIRTNRLRRGFTIRHDLVLHRGGITSAKDDVKLITKGKAFLGFLD